VYLPNAYLALGIISLITTGYWSFYGTVIRPTKLHIGGNRMLEEELVAFDSQQNYAARSLGVRVPEIREDAEKESKVDKRHFIDKTREEEKIEYMGNWPFRWERDLSRD